MDLIEKINSKFGTWYESLFGENGSAELRPKDVLRKILHAMDDNRSEGIDGKVYVPNKYILVLNLADVDERDYLLSFLDEEELSAVLHRYMAQNGYSVRGPLDFTITDTPQESAASAPKLTVKARYEKGPLEPAAPAPELVAEREASRSEIDDLPTVASLYEDDLATIYDLPKAFAQVAVTEPDGRHSLVTISGPLFTIGRSRTAGNNLVLASDGKVSKRHASIEIRDRTAVLHDLGSTNGVSVNGIRVVDRITLSPLDHIVIGDTLLVFDQTAAEDLAPSPQQPRTKAVLSPLSGGTDHILASDNLIGRGITCDLVLNDPRSANRQAEIIAHDSGTFTVEDLSNNGSTLVNERVVHPGERIKLINGDRLQFSFATYQYLEKTT
jgi:pSer/pThr/pTyr-binding forkhead associated (FHA) protein